MQKESNGKRLSIFVRKGIVKMPKMYGVLMLSCIECRYVSMASDAQYGGRLHTADVRHNRSAFVSIV